MLKRIYIIFFENKKALHVVKIAIADLLRLHMIMQIGSFCFFVDTFPYQPCAHAPLHFQLKMVLIKCCDISNEVRPMEVSEPWVDCLLEEYFNQVGFAKGPF